VESGRVMARARAHDSGLLWPDSAVNWSEMGAMVSGWQRAPGSGVAVPSPGSKGIRPRQQVS
jgi:hypothetical protein